MTSFDAIVVGGGHNGLTAAAVLARAGMKTLLLEASPEPGGMAGQRRFHPRYTAPALAHLVPAIDPAVALGAGLHPEPLERALRPADTLALSGTGDHLRLQGALGHAVSDLPGEEGAHWDALRARLALQAGVLARFLHETPPQGGRLPRSIALAGAAAALAIRRAGVEELREFGRMALMPVSDILDEELADDRLKGLVAFDATLGIRLGPRSPTSVLGAYLRLVTSGGDGSRVHFADPGSAASIVDVFAEAAQSAGVRIRTGADAARILIDRGRATGVALSCGEEIGAPVIVAATSPVTALLQLVGPRHLDAGLVREMSGLRTEGNVARLLLGLSDNPAWDGDAVRDDACRLVWAPSVRHVETQFNPQKYGELPDDPPLEIVVNRSSANAGPVLSVTIANVPYRLEQGWDAGRDRLRSHVMRRLEALAPGIGAKVVASELLAPPDIERLYRVPGGHWHHVEWQVDRLFAMRPAFGVSAYRSPVAGLWLTGAGTHPGGGVTGLPGLNAARAILAARQNR